jgi:hypothetical protein
VRDSGSSAQRRIILLEENAKAHTTYAYVEGFELDSVAAQITHRLTELVSDRQWISGKAWVVNQKQGDPSDEGDWELGINLELPDPYHEPEGWFADVEEIAIVCNDLARMHQYPFVIGIVDRHTKMGDDLFDIDGSTIDIERLRAIIGTEPPNKT